MHSLQSAYRKHYSTETALLQAMNDVIVRTVDCRQEAVLVMLDLSAAFDTLDHTILLDGLSIDTSVFLTQCCDGFRVIVLVG